MAMISFHFVCSLIIIHSLALWCVLTYSSVPRLLTLLTPYINKYRFFSCKNSRRECLTLERSSPSLSPPPRPTFFFWNPSCEHAKVPVASLLDDSRMINSRFVHVTGEDPMLSDQQQYRYMTVDDMKSMGDDSMRVNVTDDERDNRHSGGKSMKDCVSKFSSFLSISLSRSDWIPIEVELSDSLSTGSVIFSLSLFSIHCKVQRGITKGCSRRWRIN